MSNWSIQGLRGVGQVDLTLDDQKRAYVFLGSNGVGKTKTLEALLLFFLVSNRGFNTDFWFIPFVERVRCNEQELNFGPDHGEKIVWSNLMRRNQMHHAPLPIPVAIAYLAAGNRGHHELVARHMNGEPLGNFKQRQSAYFKQVEQALGNNTLYRLGMSGNLHQWFIERAQSVNPYQDIADNRKIEIDTVLELLNKLDQRIDRQLKIDGTGGVYLSIENQWRELGELSSGFSSMLKIIQAIIAAYAAFDNSANLRQVQGVVLIDEIESHLHVSWQTRIVPSLQRLFPNSTFYISTHSPLVLSQLEEGEAYLLKRDDDAVVRSHPIDSPNKRILANVLRDTFDIDLNTLKRESMQHSDQSGAKQKLLDLLTVEPRQNDSHDDGTA